jgi:hypothetical protein
MQTETYEVKGKPRSLSNWAEIAFPGCAEEVRTGRVGRERAIEVMRAAVVQFYPECVYAFGHGSALSGDYRSYSDLDVIVFNGDGQYWELRKEVFNGFPVEFSMFTLNTLEIMSFLALTVRLPLGLLAAESEILVDAKGDVAAFQEQLRSIANSMPNIDRTDETRNVRAHLFSVYVDLHKNRSLEVAQSVVLTAYPIFAKGITLAHNFWLHRTRHFVKNPDLPGASHINALHAAIAKLMQGDVAVMIAFTEELITNLGGPVWNGFKQVLRAEHMPVARMLLELQSAVMA